MPVVINEFEVMPQSRAAEDQNAPKNAGGKGGENPKMSDYEIQQILERRAERLERVAAH